MPTRSDVARVLGASWPGRAQRDPRAGECRARPGVAIDTRVVVVWLSGESGVVRELCPFILEQRGVPRVTLLSTG